MAGTKIRGITIEIGGDTSGLNKALGSVNSQIKSTQSQLKDVERLLKLDPSNTELLTQKHKLLKEAVTETKDKLKTLKETQDKIDSGKVTTSKEAYDALKREIVSCETSLKDLEKQAAQSNISLVKAGQAFDGISQKTSGVGKNMSKLTATVAGVGAAGIGAAMSLDDGYDTIITKTGATGKALQELNDVADDIYSSMAVSMEDVGIAVGEVNTRFQATGKQLQDLSEEFLKFAQINGTDLNTSIDTTDAIMTKFGIDTSRTSNVLGLFTKVGQDTGISMDTLLNSLQTNGASLQELGFSLTQSTMLLAQMEASGVDTTIGITSLKKAVTNLTDSGKPLNTALSEVISSIKNAKSDTEALNIASSTFGSKGAAEMSKAIRDGRLDINDLAASLQSYGSVVSETFEETQDPWDEATIATNNLKLAGADLGSTLLETLTPKINSTVEAIKNFAQWFRSLSDEQKNIILIIATLVAAVGPLFIFIGQMAGGVSAIIKVVQILIPIVSCLNAVLATNPIILIIAGITALIVAIILLYNKCEWFRDGVNAIVGTIVDFAKDVWEKISTFFTETIPNAFDAVISWFKDNWQGLLLLLVNPFAGAFKLLYDNCEGFRNFVNGFVEKVVDAFTGFASDIKERAVSIGTHITDGIEVAIDYIRDLPHKMTEWGKDMIDGFVAGIKSKVSNVENAVIGIGNKIKSFLHFSRPDEGPLRDYETWMPDFIGRMAEQIEQQKGKITNAVQSMAGEMKFTPAIAGTSSTTSNTTNIFNGNYKFNDKSDIDYFMNQAALRLKGAR
jgi:TP901 family phage tail tape measure protein